MKAKGTTRKTITLPLAGVLIGSILALQPVAAGPEVAAEPDDAAPQSQTIPPCDIIPLINIYYCALEYINNLNDICDAHGELPGSIGDCAYWTIEYYSDYVGDKAEDALQQPVLEDIYSLVDHAEWTVMCETGQADPDDCGESGIQGPECIPLVTCDLDTEK